MQTHKPTREGPGEDDGVVAVEDPESSDAATRGHVLEPSSTLRSASPDWGRRGEKSKTLRIRDEPGDESLSEHEHLSLIEERLKRRVVAVSSGTCDAVALSFGPFSSVNDLIDFLFRRPGGILVKR